MFLESRQWTRSQSDSSDPTPRQAHAAAVSGNQMYIHGGHTVIGQMLGDLLIFHVGAGKIMRPKFPRSLLTSSHNVIVHCVYRRLGICNLQKRRPITKIWSFIGHR